MSKTFDGAISASPSLTIPGGTVYTFADGTSLVVSGGSNAAYRANSPGFNLGSVSSSQLTDPAFQATITAAITQYGAIGYTVSTGGQVQLVFSNATTASQGMQQKMNGLSAAQTGTAEDVYVAYNGGGNPNAGTLLENVAASSGQSALLDIPYSQLSPTQKSTFASLAMQAEGFNNSSGATVASTTQQASPSSFAVAGWMLGLPVGGLNYPVDFSGLPGDTFTVSPDGNTLTINTAGGPIVYSIDPDTGKGTVSFAGASVSIDGVNLQSITHTSAGVQLQYPSSSATINLNGTTTGALSPIDLTFPTGDIAWTPVSGGNFNGVGPDGTQYFLTSGSDDNGRTTVLTSLSTDATGVPTVNYWSAFQAGAAPSSSVSFSGVSGPVTMSGGVVSVGGPQPFQFLPAGNQILGQNAVTATIGSQSVTLLGLGGSSPFAVVSAPGTTSAGAPSSIVLISSQPMNMVPGNLPDGSSVAVVGTGPNAIAVAITPGGTARPASEVSFLTSDAKVLSETTSTGVAILVPGNDGNYTVAASFFGSTLPSPIKNDDGSTTYKQVDSNGNTTTVTIGLPPGPDGTAPAAIVNESWTVPDDGSLSGLAGTTISYNIEYPPNTIGGGAQAQSTATGTAMLSSGEIVVSQTIQLASKLYALAGGTNPDISNPVGASGL